MMKTTMIKWCFTSVMTLMISPLMAVTYYVDATSGNDNNDGTTEKTALKTFAKAIGKVSEKDFLSDPAEVIFKSGVYATTGRTDLKLGRGKVFVHSQSGNPADVTIQASNNALMAVVATNSADELVISGLTFKDGVGNWGYPGGMLLGSESLSTQGKMVVSNCVFSGCMAPTGNGGAMRASGSDTHVVNCTFIDNYTDGTSSDVGSGGALDTHCGSGIYITGCTFARNRCAVDYRCGGAIATYSTKTYISRCNFYTNSVNQYGGAIYIPAYKTVEIDNCTFDGNKVTSTGDGHGAAIAMRESATVSIVDSVFANGYSALDSAAIWSDKGKLTLTGSDFCSNQADNGNGGAALISGGTLTATNCTFAGNSANHGGGIAYAGTFSSAAVNQIVDCEFLDNRAKLGGGLCVKSSNLVIRASRFFGNSVKTTTWTDDTQYGGGVANASTLTLADDSVITGIKMRDCVFGGNRACRGGGFFNGQFNTYTIENCIFTNNFAHRFGGGIYVRDDDATGRRLDTSTTIRNSFFADNSVTGNLWNAEGGAIYVAGAKAAYGNCPRIIESCTIVSNKVSCITDNNAQGAGLALHNSFRCAVSNSVVAFNLRNWQANSRVYSYGNEVTTLYYCCAWPDNSSAFKTDNFCISADPKFAGAANGDYRLRGGSPCRGTGAVAGWMTNAVDLDGNARLGGKNKTIVDMGAWQFATGFLLLLR